MSNQSKQQGVVLVVGLLMLLLITIIGVSALSKTGSNERTTGNNQFSTVNFQAAESAVKVMFSRAEVEPTILDKDDLVDDKIITQVNSFDVELNKNFVAMNVATRSVARFCGGDPTATGTSFSSGTGSPVPEVLAFDVIGESTIGGTGAQENHLRSGSLLSPTGLGIKFNEVGKTSEICADP